MYVTVFFPRSISVVPIFRSWIVPPLGGSLTSVFHHEMRHFDKDPRFVYQVRGECKRRKICEQLACPRYARARPPRRIDRQTRSFIEHDGTSANLIEPRPS